MKAITTATRTIQAAKALVLMSQGKTQAEACAEVGITPYIMRTWLGKDPEALETIRDLTIELERTNLAEIIIARAAILRRISDVVATTPLPVRDLVVVDTHLRDLQEELENKYGTQSQDADAQSFLLTGPAVTMHESTFSAKVTTFEIKPGDKNEPAGDIIDAEFEEEEDQ
jgi:hypothetical protein